MISVLCVGERLVWGLLTSYLRNLIPTVGNAYRGHLFKLLVSGGHSHCKWIFTHKLCEISLSPHWRPQLCRNRATWKQDDFSFELVTAQLPDAGTSASRFVQLSATAAASRPGEMPHHKELWYIHSWEITVLKKKWDHQKEIDPSAHRKVTLLIFIL